MTFEEGGQMLSTMPILIALSASVAEAAYQFGYTQPDIDTMASNYGITGADKSFLEDQYLAPFNCIKHGDLCDLVGPVNAEIVLQLSGDMAINGDPDTTINSTLEAEILAREDLWFQANYPAGIPAADPYWNIGVDYSLTLPDKAYGTPYVCDSVSFTNDPSIKKREHREYTLGGQNHRHETRAWWQNSGVYRSEGGTSRHFISTGGAYNPVNIQQTISVSGANSDPTCPSYCDAWTTTDNKVKLVAFWSVLGGSGMFRFVLAESWAGTATAYGAAADVTNWTSTVCAP